MTPAPEAAAPELDEHTTRHVVDNVTDTLSKCPYQLVPGAGFEPARPLRARGV